MRRRPGLLALSSPWQFALVMKNVFRQSKSNILVFQFRLYDAQR